MSVESTTVVNLVCSAHAGATWLGLLLGAHPEIFCIGESGNIPRDRQPTCMIHGPTCPVWSRFQGDSPENSFAQAARLSGRRIVVAKNAEAHEVVTAPGQPPIVVKLVHLLRDGRAVMASVLRKYPDRPPRRAARQWAHEIRKAQRVIRGFDAPHVHRMHYEQLASNTEAELRRLCEFIGLPYNPAMMTPWSDDLHYLGGNLGTLYSIAQKRGVELPPDPRETEREKFNPNWDLPFYRRQDPSKLIDERWKREITLRHRLVFALIGGRLNCKYGYPAFSL